MHQPLPGFLGKVSFRQKYHTRGAAMDLGLGHRHLDGRLAEEHAVIADDANRIALDMPRRQWLQNERADDLFPSDV